MPNISFDIFFNEDIVNITASRSNGSAPKVKPAWKTRTAPKLPKKVEPKTAAFARPSKVTELSDSEEEEAKPEQKQIKAAPKASSKPKETPKPKETSKPKEASKPEASAKKIPKLPPKNTSKPNGTAKA